MHPLSITLQQIAQYCGKETYLKGIDYEDSQAMILRYRDDRMLLGICEGVSAPRYIVKLVINGSRIEYSSCTCAYNRYVPCKHIAALLITWYYYPQTFVEKNKWHESLEASYSKQELIELMGKILDIYTPRPDQSGAVQA